MHGGYRQEAKAAYLQAAAQLHELEDHGFAAGFMSGERTRGRKPGKLLQPGRRKQG
jgi:hypothetical protein